MLRSAAALSILTVFLSACSSAKSDIIKIGYIGPLSGDASPYGADTLNGMKMKVEDINTMIGGLQGKHIEIVAEDGHCNAQAATAAAQKLINTDKVAAIIGGQCNAETLAAAVVAQKSKVVMISPISTSPDIASIGDYIFHLAPDDSNKGKALATYLQNQHLIKIAILSEQSDVTSAIHTAVTNTAGPNTIILDQQISQAGDAKAAIAALKGTQFDVFVANVQSSDIGVAMIREFRAAGFKQPVLTTDALDSDSLARSASGTLEGVKLISLSSKLGEGSQNSFASRFRAKYGEPQSTISFAALSYDATGILVQAIQSAMSDNLELNTQLRAISKYAGAVGDFHFDAQGDAVGIGYVVKEIRDGKIVEGQEIDLEQ